MKLVRINYLLLMVIALAFGSFANAQSMSLERIVNGLSSPTFATHAPGDADRLYIIQRSGAIRILDLNTGTLNASNFMTVPSVNTSFEGGLLGMAFHPDFENNNYFYVNYTTSVGGGGFRTRISRFTATNANTASSATEQVVIEVGQPFQNHNAGWIGFSPVDNYLYITMGDGGSGFDPGNRGQDITNQLLGKMLRLDVDGDDFPGDALRNYAIPNDNPFVGVTGDDEIYLYGLRNPFRCSFDRANGNLYIGDVGQGAREEISLYPAGYDGDRNMGWRLREGTIATPSVGGPPPSDHVGPIYDYVRTGPFGGFSVTGGVVYRGPIAGLQGSYLFADYGTDNFWSFIYDGSDPSTFNGSNFTDLIRWNGIFTTDIGTLNNIVAFAEDLNGDVYIVELSGEIYKIVDGNITNPPIDGTIDLVIPFVGVYDSGTNADLEQSDDAALKYRNVHVETGDPTLQIEFRGTVPLAQPSRLLFNFESRVTTPNVTQVTEIYNFLTGQYEVFDTRNASVTDDAYTTEVTGAAVYVNVDGSVRARITLSANGPVIGQPWAVIMDQAQFQVIE